MKITKHDDGGGAFAWTNDKNNGFISFTPAAPDGDTSTAEGMYGAARLGDRRFWCQDGKDLVYSFRSLVNGSTSAPAYMRRMAKQAQKDLSKEVTA